MVWHWAVAQVWQYPCCYRRWHQQRTKQHMWFGTGHLLRAGSITAVAGDGASREQSSVCQGGPGKAAPAQRGTRAERQYQVLKYQQKLLLSLV